MSYSANGRFAVELASRALPEDLRVEAAQRAEPGTAESEGELPDSWMLAFVYRVGASGELGELSRFPLLDGTRFQGALVSDDGRHVVTDGSDGIVIYLQEGTVIRSLSSADLLTPADLVALRSISRMSWNRDVAIDDAAQTLVLRFTCPNAEGREARVTLDPGPPSESALPLDPTAAACAPGVDEHGWEKAPRLPLEALASRTEALSLPSFTETARLTRVVGRVIVELLVSPDGEVTCARILKGLPMGLGEAAREAASRWRFSPASWGGGPVQTAASFDFSFVEVQPPPD